MLFNWLLYLLAAGALIWSWQRDREKTRRALQITGRQLVNLFPALLGIIGLIGLMLALVPREIIAHFLGDNSWGGILTAALAGSIVLLPAFIAFPLGSSLLAAGASIKAVACFLTTVLMVGIITAPMEIQLFGKQFTLWRNLSGFVAALLIGLIMGVILR